ncbi:MAG: histidine kinase dimerization/phospho-acceptor domain-containing protein [Bacteroidota bacterium]
MDTESNKFENIYKGLISALERKDRAIRRYANITSHELRAPVASMLGLIQLWQKHQEDEAFSRTIMEKMEECAQNLDQVATRLNAELDPNMNIINPEIARHQFQD